jgi:hypothetical protein
MVTCLADWAEITGDNGRSTFLQKQLDLAESGNFWRLIYHYDRTLKTSCEEAFTQPPNFQFLLPSSFVRKAQTSDPPAAMGVAFLPSKADRRLVSLCFFFAFGSFLWGYVHQKIS